jgi:hypothetical protein
MSSTQRSRPRRRFPRRSLGALLVCGAACASGALLPSSGCARTPIQVPTRALERSGRSAFVCLGDPNGAVRPQLPLERCTGGLVSSISQYLGADGGAVSAVPHLYALVTQTTRGEVAVIDTTATNNSVLDEDPAIPGASFLPVGAQPVDIVSTPGGTATFVGVAEVGREALFALPSSQIRPASAEGAGGSGGGTADGRPPPEISSWPACRLPFAPGPMLLLADPPSEKGAVRTSCDAPTYTTSPDGDPAMDLGQEGKGRQKLIVTIPDAGGLAVIDAQALLDRAPGSFDPCPVERWIPLSTDVPILPEPPPPSGTACVNPTVDPPAVASNVVARPSGLSYAAGRLYVSDLAAPLIHVIDLPTPCEPVEITPLLPTSLEDPSRIVTTTHVAVSPTLTPALKRYLYAIDADDGSAMVFDVSDDTLGKVPLRRSGRLEWNPFEPPDRIRYSAPVADLLIVQRDVPATDPATGVAVEGVRCDPSPTLRATCTDLTQESCDVATAYRTSLTYDSGAGPRKLRGTFAMLALTSGRVAVIDIDDYDAPCRGPDQYSPLYGCEGLEKVAGSCGADDPCDKGSTCSAGTTDDPGFCTLACSINDSTACRGSSLCSNGSTCSLATSHEASCNVVLPNTPRLGVYAAAGSASGQHVPGLSIFPLLYDAKGTLVAADEASPRLVATVPAQETNAPLLLAVGGTEYVIDRSAGTLALDGNVTAGYKHVLAMNLEDPRAHLVAQGWSVTFEGPIPGFDFKAATLLPGGANAPIERLREVNSRFCDAGVHSEKAVNEMLGRDDDETRMLADYVQITSPLLDQKADYWNTEGLACSFQTCQSTFGEGESALTSRDLRIVEAYQDHVEVVPRDMSRFQKPGPEGMSVDMTAAEVGTLTRCCFPGQVYFSVRVGNQWAVRGEANGFLHHVIADPETGVCRDSCDPRLARKNGRVRVTPRDSVVTDGSAEALINPMFRLAVQDAPSLSPVDARNRRDYVFRFITQGSFVPLLVDLSTDSKTLISPVGMSYIPSTGDLAVTDGSINGLILVNLAGVSVTRQFF